MKLIIPRDLLSKSLRRCDLKGAPTGNSALSCVALSARSVPDMPGGLDLRATNGLLGVATMIACTTEREGDVFVNTRQLMSVVNSMPPVTLTLESKGEELLVVGGNRRWKGKTRPLTDIKPLPEPPPVAALKIPAEEFLAGLARVQFVVENVGAEFTARQGIYFDVAGDEANSVVLGDHMVARDQRTLKLGATWHGLLPEVVLAHAREIAQEEGKGWLELFSNEHYTWIQNSSTMLVYNPPPGEYHDWRHYMSQIKPKPVCRLPRLAMIESLKALVAAAAQDEVVARTWVQVRPDGTVAIDYYQGQESAFTFHDEMSVTDITESALPAFIVNAAYLRDAIDAAGSDPVLNLVDEKHVALTTEDGFFWACALVYPEAGERPPSGDLPLTPQPEVKAPAPGASPEPDKPKRSGRKPQAAK